MSVFHKVYSFHGDTGRHVQLFVAPTFDLHVPSKYIVNYKMIHNDHLSYPLFSELDDDLSK